MSGGRKLVIEVDDAELTCRIVEGILNLTRPKGKTARETLDDMQAGSASAQAMVADCRRAGARVMEYVAECAGRGNRVQ